MSKILIVVVLFLSVTGTPSLAQDRKMQFGMLAWGSIKYQFLSAGDRNYHLFGDAGFGGVARIRGSEEGAIAFQPKLVFVRENIGYHQTSSVKYYIESINIVFNPEVVIPTRHEHWQLAAGIGIDWVLDNDVAVSVNNTGFASGNLSEAYQIIREARRPVIPFISAGVLYQVKGGLHMQLALRQDLRNAFPEDTEVTFYGGSDVLTVQLGHQPTRLGLGILYLF